MDYTPQPIDTEAVTLPSDLLKLTEKLAESTHDHWAAQRFSQGWRYGPQRSDAEKTNPCLAPYADLPDEEKEYDRRTATETLKAIIALGYEIRSPR